MTTEERTRITVWQRMWPLALLAATVCFFISGLATLGEKSLWLDEMRTGYAALAPSALHMNVLRYIILNDPVGPLYDLLVAEFCALFGTSDLMLRLPSLIFASLSVAAFGALARRFLSAGASLAAICFYFFSMNTLYFAQEARPYAMLLLWSLLAYLLNLSPPRHVRRRTLLVSLLFSTGMYIHIVFAFVIANCILHELFFASRIRVGSESPLPVTRHLIKELVASSVARGAMAAGLAYLPWFIILLTQSADPSRTPELKTELGKSLIAAIGGLLIGNAYARIQIVSMAIAAAIVLWTYGVVRLHTHRPEGRRVILVWTLSPVALTLIALALFRDTYNFFHFRYLLPVMPFLILPMASGLSVFVNQNVLGLFRRKNESWPERMAALWLQPRALIRFVYVFVVLVFLFSNTANRIAYGHSEQQNWRDAYRFLRQSAQPGDTIILHGIAAPAIEFYALREPVPLTFLKTNDLKVIANRTRFMGNTWLVDYKDHWHPEFFRTSRHLLDALFQPQHNSRGVLGDIMIGLNQGNTLTEKRTFCFLLSTNNAPASDLKALDQFSCRFFVLKHSCSAPTDLRANTCTTHFDITVPMDQITRISIPRQENAGLSVWAQNQKKMFYVSFKNKKQTKLRLKKDRYTIGFYLDLQEQTERTSETGQRPAKFPPLCMTIEPDEPFAIPDIADELVYGNHLLNWIRK